MINDCAFVGETLLKYFPPDIEKHHIKRSRGVWSKTFGIAYNIMRSKADVYHAHYLLQDCYITERLGKHPLIGHAHGSDLRVSLRHSAWKRIVRHNLKHCDKVLVSTPDVLGLARAFRADADYLPNPVDTNIFYPKPLVAHDGKMRVLIASSAWIAKGTDIIIHALGELRDKVEASMITYGVDYAQMLALARSLNLQINTLPRLTHDNIREYYWNADLILDQFRCGAVGNVFLEAIACGRPAIGYVSSEYPEYEKLPLKDINSSEKIVKAIENVKDLTDLWKTQYDYLKAEHDVNAIVKKTLELYEELCSIE